MKDWGRALLLLITFRPNADKLLPVWLIYPAQLSLKRQLISFDKSLVRLGSPEEVMVPSY